MRKTLTTAALLLALSCPAFAGEMLTPPAPQPPPAPASAALEPTTEATTEDGTQGTYVQIALELLAVLPSIL
jgi:hypothetical protein